MAEDCTRDDRGRWITAPVSPAPITHANARTMARARWDRHRERVRQVLAATVGDAIPDIVDPLDPDAGTLVLAARTAQQLMDSQRPQPDTLTALLRAADAIPDRRADADAPGGAADVLGLADADAMLLVVRRAKGG